MKRTVALLLCVCLMSMFCACQSNSGSTKQNYAQTVANQTAEEAFERCFLVEFNSNIDSKASLIKESYYVGVDIVKTMENMIVLSTIEYDFANHDELVNEFIAQIIEAGEYTTSVPTEYGYIDITDDETTEKLITALEETENITEFVEVLLDFIEFSEEGTDNSEEISAEFNVSCTPLTSEEYQEVYDEIILNMREYQENGLAFIYDANSIQDINYVTGTVVVHFQGETETMDLSDSYIPLIKTDKGWFVPIGGF